MARILISGGAGFIGSVLTRTLLEQGHSVTVLDILERGGAGLIPCCSYSGFTFIHGDCRDSTVIVQALHKVDAVIPLAAIVGAGACDRRPKAAREVNSGAIHELLRHRSNSQAVIYPMTNSGYGTATHEDVCTEDSPLAPVSLYGRTKVIAEQAMLREENTYSLRLATVFGASPAMRWDLLVNDFVRRAVKDRYIAVFEGTYRRNFIHIQDVACCIAWMLETLVNKPLEGRVFNLGNDDCNMTKHELAHAVAKQVPGTMVVPIEQGTDPDKRDYLVSNKRLKDAGFEASHNLTAGIQEIIKAVQLA